MTEILATDRVSKHYPLGKVLVPALRDVSVRVRSGEFISLAGPSGSGKTTLLNLIGCVDTPSSGTMIVAGRDVGAMTERQRTHLRLHTIGFIFQSFNLINVLDVFRNVELPLLLQRVASATERKHRVSKLLARVGLESLTRHRPNELSGGQRQRVAIARALVTRPKLVLADEPTANLDSQTGAEVLELMRELNERENTTFIFSTHDPRVMAYAHRVIHMADGQLVTRDAARADLHTA